MTELAARSLHPNRICIWPVETGGYGIPSELVRKIVASAGTKPVPDTECTR